MSLPQHIAIIMDGNGRWATQRGLSRNEGHKAGGQALREVVTECRSLGVKQLTVYALSVENWQRPMEEIKHIMELLTEFLRVELPILLEHDICLQALGRLEDLPLLQRQGLLQVMKRTSHCKSMVLNLALSYSGREEILHAARTLAEKNLRGSQITEEEFRKALYLPNMPDPDLVIRTSGESRVSNFLLFQMAYSEFYFTNTLWPDFNKVELHKALESFAQRQRRFGKI